MKKPACLVLICFVSGITYAFGGGPKGSPVLANSSIKKSEKSMNKQVGNFQSHKRYSSIVNGPGSKAVKKQQGRAVPAGKGL